MVTPGAIKCDIPSEQLQNGEWALWYYESLPIQLFKGRSSFYSEGLLFNA
jgi:hypothetical protein